MICYLTTVFYFPIILSYQLLSMCLYPNQKLALIRSISINVLLGSLTIIKICCQEKKKKTRKRERRRNWKEEVHYICFNNWILEEPELRNLEWNLRCLGGLPELVDFILLLLFLLLLSVTHISKITLKTLPEG